ncbi:hypothetical protein [Nocardia asiatica]|uniref:hypothetical protein n=1 Tax=Nocardia asiatica TaxID=209252 RepID=UPI003EE3A4D4
MFSLLTKLAEILSSYGVRFLDGRRGARDSDVAGQILSVILLLQELIVHGEEILAAVTRLLAGRADIGAGTVLAELLQNQIERLEALRSTLTDMRPLLATVDAELYLDLVPFLDEKSGLLSQWQRQAVRSRYSTTTYFFLHEEDLQRAIEVGRTLTGPDGMELDREPYLLAVADGLRRARALEVRDIRSAESQDRTDEIATARAQLARARTLCAELAQRMESVLGAEAIAGLRRSLAGRAKGRG